jgi:hypothetical protein
MICQRAIEEQAQQIVNNFVANLNDVLPGVKPFEAW